MKNECDRIDDIVTKIEKMMKAYSYGVKRMHEIRLTKRIWIDYEWAHQ